MARASAAALLLVALAAAAAAGAARAEEVVCQHGLYPPPAGYAIPWERVDLDADAATRWDAVVRPRAAAMRDMMDSVLDLLPRVLQQPLLERLHDHLGEKVKYMPHPVDAELAGIAEASGLDIGLVMMYNIFYELFSVCTSIVAQDAAGNVLHARNLDFGLFMGYDWHNHSWALTEKLRPLLVNVEWVRGGQVLFRSTQYAGYVGVLTGSRVGGFSVTIDSRFDDNFDKGVIAWLDGNHTANWVSLATRAALVDADSYDTAVQALASELLVAPVYYIVSGVKSGEGVVVTRGLDWADLYTLEHQLAAGSYYVLETNYDHWKPPLFIDNRRGAAQKCMNETTQAHISKETLWDVLGTRPVLNQLSTYGVLMRADTGAFESYLQYCPPPGCPLF